MLPSIINSRLMNNGMYPDAMVGWMFSHVCADANARGIAEMQGRRQEDTS